jgi:hypothetical protein
MDLTFWISFTFLQRFPVFGRRFSGIQFKNPVKMALIRETSEVGDF